MFSKGDKDSAAAAPSGFPGTKKSRAGVPSIISADLNIVGDLKSNGDIQIDGAVEGDITSHDLTVGEDAVVRGVLVAEVVRIYGAVHGEVRANSVILASTAHVEGDIAHQTLSMETGAKLEGRVSQLEKGIGGQTQAAAKPKPRSRRWRGRQAGPDLLWDEGLANASVRRFGIGVLRRQIGDFSFH